MQFHISIRASIFEWYVVWCGSKNGYQKDICLIEIGLHAQTLTTILSSTASTIERNLYDHFNKRKNHDFDKDSDTQTDLRKS